MSSSVLLIFQIIVISTLTLISIKLLNIISVAKYEKRINKFSLESLRSDEISLFDKIDGIYFKLLKKINKKLEKSKFLVDYSKKYEKYIKPHSKREPMDFITTKFLSFLALLLLVIIADIYWLKSVTFFQISLSFLIGFFAPDIFLFITRKKNNKEIENDLLKAITIMNNAFKSGNSIMQALLIVSDEIDGELGQEFKKMYIDLTYGLDLDIVFSRFSKRIDIEEVKYMTTSLTILNKTGGNIANVFSSIEKSFFGRRKLRSEMKALTSTANFMYKVLAIIPFAIMGAIMLVNPSYFSPLFTNPIGIAILTLIIIIYITYIIIIKKMMKVEGI